MHTARLPRRLQPLDPGVRQGAIAEWDETGVQIAAGQFNEDKPDGTWTFRKPGTHETFKVIYKAGVEVLTALIPASEFREWEETDTPCQ